MGWVFKLVSGTNTLDLSAGAPGTAGYGIRDATVDSPAGSDTMTLTLNFYTEAANQTEVVRRLEAQINQYLKWAHAYELRERADPVEFWVLPNDGVGIEPTFGAVSRRRLVLGGSIVPPYGGPGMAYQGTTIPGYTLTLRCRPFWHGLTHWMLCGTGGIIEDTTNQGLQVWESTTNLCEYPNEYTGWTVSSASIFDLDSAAQRIYGATRNGIDGFRIVAGASVNSYAYRSEIASPAQSASYMMTAYLRGIGTTIGQSASLIIQETGGACTTVSTAVAYALTNTWTRYSASRSVTNASRDALEIYLYPPTGASGYELQACDIQLENKAASTPFADGNSGLGHRWSGSPSKSTSTRQSAVLYGSTYSSILNPSAWTVSMWVKDLSWADGKLHYLFYSGVPTKIALFRQTDNALYLRNTDAAGNQTNVSVSTAAYTSANWYHIVICGQHNDLRMYVNGASVGTPSTNVDMPSLLPSTFYIGSDGAANQANCTISSDFRIYNQALTTAQVASLYAAGRGPGCLPYAATLEGGLTADPPTVRVYNHESASPNTQNWIQLGNVPGDEESAMHWWITNVNSATSFKRMATLYYGLRKYEGDQAIFSVAPYTRNPSLDADTVATADANATYGWKYRVSPSDATWDAVRITTTMPNMPGRWHLYLRCYDGGAAIGIWHVRAQVYAGYGPTVYYPDSDGATAPAVSTWTLVDLGEIELPPTLGGQVPAGGNLDFVIWAKRDSGVTTLDIDCAMLVPAECAGKLGDPTSNYIRSTFEMDGISYETAVHGSINTTFYPDTYSTYPIDNWHGPFATLTPNTPQRMVFANLSLYTDYMHTIGTSNIMDFAAQIEPHYSSPW